MTIEELNMLEGNSRVRNKAIGAAFQYMHIVKNHPTATQAEVAEATGIALGTVKRFFPALQKKSAVKRNGNNKEGSWSVLVPLQ